MRNSPYLLLKQPVAFWEKDIQVDGKGLFKAVTKAGVNAIMGKVPELIMSTSEILASMGLKDAPDAVAWILTRRALERAMLALAFEANIPLSEKLKELEPVADAADAALSTVEVELSPDFFRHPQQMPLMEAVKPIFAEWLAAAGLSPVEAVAVAERLPAYFVFALGDEWNSAPAQYAETLKPTQHPFAEAGEWEMGWMRYNAYLQKQVQTGLFDMPFTLSQLYIPLRASYALLRREEEDGIQGEQTRKLRPDSEGTRVLVDLADELDAWITQNRSDDAIRLINGGPGSGKSSFLKMYAVRRAESNSRPRVLYLPLHLLDHKGNLEESVGVFFRETGLLPGNPLSPDVQKEPLLLLFDGLDELALQGKLGAEAANAFALEVIQKLNQRNAGTLRLKAILSGRNVAIQACASHFRGTGKILDVEPYLIEIEQFKQQRTPDVSDQRDTWWREYGKISGSTFDGVPDELRGNHQLDEITKWPLLNHLVALSYEAGNRDFSNLNRVYRSLLQDVYSRAYEQKKIHRAISNLTEKNFIRILEEIALAAWHGRGRTTTIREIHEHCEAAGVMSLLKDFKSDQMEGRVAQLLLAFYFRQAGTNSEGDAAFEFTHKSFGEYLTACRLVRAIEKIHKEIIAHEEDVDEGWEEKKALAYWVEVCGPTAIDHYILKFLRDEVAVRGAQEGAWQRTLTRLLNHVLRHGQPMESAKLERYQEMEQQARNATETLIAALNACVLSSQEPKRFKVDWPSVITPRQLFTKLCSEFYGLSQVFLQCLDYWDLSNAELAYFMFGESRLIEVSFQHAVLDSAYLQGAHLKGAHLLRTNFPRAILTGADLGKANLKEANLKEANLEGANLKEANLEGGKLEEANLGGAILVGANLEGANLEGANLDGANLDGANLDGAILMAESLKRVIGAYRGHPRFIGS